MPPEVLKKQNKVIGYLRWFIIVLLPIVFVAGFILQSHKTRGQIINTMIKLPEKAFFIMMRRGMFANRNFTEATIWLNRQLDLVNWYSSGRNPMLPGLIYNTDYLMRRALFREEYNAVRPFLERMVGFYPELFLARLWLGHALKHVDPIEAIEQLKQAVRLSSADERPYRVAIAIALKKKNTQLLNKWCALYQKSQLGGPQDKHNHSMFNGVGIRKLALEVVDRSGEKELIATTGLKLEEKRSYDFSLKKSTLIDGLRLHFGVVAGVGIAVNRIKLYRNGRMVADYENNLILTSRNGFHLSDGSIISTAETGETIIIHLPEVGFGEIDKVVVDIFIKRQGLATPYPCGEVNNELS